MPDFPDHFSAASHGYASHRPVWPEAFADDLAELAAGGTVWEAGCGSGQLTRVLADRVASVEATDASDAQIAAASPHPRVRYRVAPAEDPGLPDGSATLVVAAQAAHWFDLPRFYGAAARVAPGGAIVLATYAGCTVDPAIDPILRAFHEGLLDRFWPPERVHVDAGYADLPFPFPPIALPERAITACWEVDALLGYVDTWSAVRALERAGRRGDFERFADAVRAAWTGGERQVRWPIAVRAGRLPG